MKESSDLVEVYLFYEVVLGRVGLTNHELTSSCQGNKSPVARACCWGNSGLGLGGDRSFSCSHCRTQPRSHLYSRRSWCPQVFRELFRPLKVSLAKWMILDSTHKLLVLYCKRLLTIVLPLVVQSLVSDSLWRMDCQDASLPCPSLIPRVFSSSCPLSQWWHQPSHPL